MRPVVLNLSTWTWSKGPIQGQDIPTPLPRHRSACWRVTPHTLLLLGGSSASSSFLGAVHKLNLVTLKWEGVPQTLQLPFSRLGRVAGHSLAGCIGFGGCILTRHGDISPVAKMDVLLLGRPWHGVQGGTSSSRIQEDVASDSCLSSQDLYDATNDSMCCDHSIDASDDSNDEEHDTSENSDNEEHDGNAESDADQL